MKPKSRCGSKTPSKRSSRVAKKLVSKPSSRWITKECKNNHANGGSYTRTTPGCKGRGTKYVIKHVLGRQNKGSTTISFCQKCNK